MRAARILVACALLTGCTSPESEVSVGPGVGLASRAIIGGTETAAYPEVMLLIARRPGSPLATVCTASMVSPHVALTAAHCLDPRLVGSTAEFSLFPGPDIDKAAFGDFLKVNATHFNDHFDPQNITNGSDIGVVILADAQVSTLPINRNALTDDLIGAPATLVGYGKSDGADTTGATAGKKRVATTVMDKYTDELVRFGEPSKTSCEGDSGGPGLMDLNGRPTIVGVVSFGVPACDEMVSDTRVDAYSDWIDGYIDEADPGFLTGVDRGDKGGCTVSGRAPQGQAPGALLLLTLLLLYRRQRAM